MSLADIQSAFSAGEISPELYGEVDLRKLGSAATTLRNLFVNYRGGALSRGGLAFVGRCKQPTSGGFTVATGNIAVAANPSNGDNFTINGTVFTFVTSGASGNQVNIVAGSAGLTIAALVDLLSASIDPLITAANYFSTGDATTATLFISYKTAGTLGNSFTIAASAGTPSAAHLTGGTGPSGPPRPIPFQFSNTQAYILELGDLYMRFVYQGGYVLEPPVGITGASQANPCTISVTGTPFSNGDWVYASGIGGMTPLNGNTYIVAAAGAGSFTLHDLNGSPVNSTGFPAFTTGGTFARLYTVTTPYAAVDLPYLKFAQSADVMSLTCSNPITGIEYPPYTLTRLAATNWTLAATVFDSVIDPPASVSANANTAAAPGGVNASFAYVVTAVDADGNESVASVVATCNGADIQVQAGSNTIDWDAVATAKYYNVYRAPPSVDGGSPIPVPDGSIFGYVGSAYGLEFTDTQVSPDLTQTPPIHGNPFAPGQILGMTITSPSTGLTGVGYTITTSTGSQFAGVPLVNAGVLGGFLIDNHGKLYADNDTITFTTGAGTPPTANLVIGPHSGTYPGVTAYFQQRLFYANTFNNPDTFWASQTGRFKNLDTSDPPVATDAITASPWTEQVNGIQWLVPMPGGLIAMTGLRAWQIVGEGSYQLNVQPVTPSTVQAQPQAFNGCSATVPPIVIDYDVLYVQSVGQSTVFDLAWNLLVSIYTGIDLTLLSSHLFAGRQIIQWAWSRQPYKVLWACCDDGTMLSLTYLKEQEVWGWARHDTKGLVVGITSIREPPVDAVYAIVLRPSTVNASGIYCMERMDDRIWTTVEDTFAVDSAVSNPMTYPAGSVVASAASGAGVTFTASQPTFTAASVGQILRMSGGIVRITGFTNVQVAVGTWVLAGNAGPFGLPYAAGGTWSLASPVTSLKAPHLGGMTGLVGMADGVPLTGLSASATGNIPLPFTASNVKVGLPFLAQLQTPYINGNAVVQGARKAIQAVTARIVSSGSFQTGTNQPDGAAQNPPTIGSTWTAGMSPADILQPTGGQTAPVQYTSPGGATVTPLFTGDIRVTGVGASWISKGQVAVQQTLPLPLEVVALVPELLPGDTPEAAYKQQPPRQAQPPRGPGRWQLRA